MANKLIDSGMTLSLNGAIKIGKPYWLEWSERSDLRDQPLYTGCPRLGSVAGPVIQATGRSEFEDMVT
jgi:hypothetical protein